MYRLACVLLVSLTGCGPLMFPMVERLSDKDQAQVDDAWKNMFDPPDRLGRELLLDVLIHMNLYQHGIDRLTLVSEKEVGDARVVMSIRFDRTHPGFDEFVISYVDAHGQELRRERYTTGEIEERLHATRWRMGEPELPNSGEAEVRQIRNAEWMRKLYAATQPASATTAPSEGPEP